jgi:nucleoside-diphosphate-sugar epimerase
MKVLVTGGSGLIGRETVRELRDAGHEVFNVDRVRPEGRGRWRSIQIDMCDAGQVYDAFAQVRPEGVCHIAANPAYTGFARNSSFANNVMSTYNVMQAAGDFGVRRFISASSIMGTGWVTTEKLPDKLPFDETAITPSPNAYSLSKLIGETIADSMAVRYPNMTLASLRINGVIPPEDYADLDVARSRFPGEGSQTYWSYIDLRDVAGAFRAALEGKNDGHEVFLIAAADTCIDMPIQEAMRKRFGERVNIAMDHPPFKSLVDCSKMKRFFGWEPKHSWRESGGTGVSPV